LPVAAAWEDVLASAQDRDPRSHYDALEGVWTRFQRLLALEVLAAATPILPDRPPLPLDLLAERVSLGHWSQFLDKALPRVRLLKGESGATRSLALQYRARRRAPAATRLIAELREILGARGMRPPHDEKLSHATLLKQLVQLRNRVNHDPRPTTKQLRSIVAALEPAVAELLADEQLRSTMRLRAVGPAGEEIDLDGPTAIGERGLASFWQDATIHAGVEAENDLRGIVFCTTCRGCHDLQVFWLDELGQPGSGAFFRCTRCGAPARSTRWSTALSQRLTRIVEATPWVELERRPLRARAGEPAQLSFQVYNPRCTPFRDLDLRLALPDDVDELEGAGALAMLAPRRRALLQAQVLATRPGRYEIRPTLRWRSDEGELCERELDRLALDAYREWHTGGLVGRDRELAVLDEALRDALVGTGAVVCIEGRDGVGRGALVQTFMERVQRDRERIAVLSSRCEWDDLRQTQPMADLVLKYARYYLRVDGWQSPFGCTDVLLFPGDLLAAIEKVAEAAGLEIQSLAPRVREVRPESYAEQSALALEELVDAISYDYAALVLCIEEVDNAHPRTLQLIQSLAASIKRRRLVLVLTRQPDPLERPSDVVKRLQNLGRNPRTRMISLGPLEREHVDRLLDRQYPRNTFTIGFRDRIWETTGGFPFFVTQTLESLEIAGVISRREAEWECVLDPAEIDVPGEVQKAIERRLRKLPDDYLGIVKRAAVLGHRFPLELLEGAIREGPVPLQPRLRLSSVLGELVRTYEVIRDSGGEYEFSHRRLWNAAYHQLLPAEREELHAAVVKYLRLQPESLERDIMIADHSLKAMRTTEAVQATLGVCERLFGFGRYEQACTLLERALQQSQQVAGVDASARRRLHVLAARGRRHVGRLEEAIALEADNIRDAQAEGDSEQLVRSLIGEAMAYRDLDDLAAADTLLTRAAREAAVAHLDLLEVEALAARGAVLQARGDPAASQVIQHCIARCAMTPGTERVRGQCLLTLARKAHDEGHFGHTLELAAEAREVFRAAGHDGLRAMAEYALSFGHEALGDLERATAATREAMALRESMGDSVGLAAAHLRLGQLQLRKGEVPRARDHITRSMALWERIGNRERVGAALLALARLELEADHATTARACADRALGAFRECGKPERVAAAHAVLLRAMIRDAEKDAVEAAATDAWDDVGRELQPSAARLELVLARAAALRFAGRFDAAGELLDEEEQQLTDSPTPQARGALLFERACLKRAIHDPVAAVAVARQAATALQACGDEMQSCKARTLAASSLVDTGQLDEAERELVQLCERCDELNDPLGRALCLRQLIRIAVASGDHARAQELYAESRAIHEELEDYRGIGILDDEPR
jgi:tetratricopeptide (TPR) repeat protein